MNYEEMYNKTVKFLEDYYKTYTSILNPLLVASKLDIDKQQYIELRKEYKPFDDLCKRLEFSCEAIIIQNLLNSDNDNVKIFLLKSIFGYQDESNTEQTFNEDNLKKISEYSKKKLKA